MSRADKGADRFRKTALLLVVLGVSILFVALIYPFLMTLLLAAIASGLVHPLFRRLEAGLRGRSTLAALLTVLAVLVVLIAPFIAFLGVVTSEALRASDAVSSWASERVAAGGLGAQIPDWLPFADLLEPYSEPVLAKAREFAGTIGTFLVRSLSRATQGTFLFLVNLGIMLYAMFFFLQGGRGALDRLLTYLPIPAADKERLLQRGLSVTRATLKGTFVVGIVQGALAGGAFAVVGIAGAAFWGTVMAVLSVIPALGAALVWIPASIVLLLSGQIAAGIGLAVWCTAVVSSVDNVLRPRLVGGDTKMPDLLILVSTLGGISMFGAVGVVVGPIVAGLFTTVWEIFGAAYADVFERPGRPAGDADPPAQ